MMHGADGGGAGGLPAHGGEKPCDILIEAVGPELYRGNFFRRTGLPVLAGAREISKGVDQLRLSAELGLAGSNAAFVPEGLLTPEQIRESAQAFRDPRVRLLHEFFWFWPENYPEDPQDGAIASLLGGGTEPALEMWCQAAAAGGDTAAHNLAVYCHLVALDWEQVPAPSEDLLDEVWRKALRHWAQVAGDDRIWRRLRARVGQLADAQLPEAFVDEMRASLPDALSKINAGLALRHGERGRLNRAASHAGMVAAIHGDAAAARRALDSSAGPLGRRIGLQAAEARRIFGDDAAQGLAAAAALLDNTAADLRLVEILGGRGLEFHRGLSSRVADAALAGIVAYQRETGDNHGCLRELGRLLGLEVMPEIKARLDGAHQVIQKNIVSV